MLIDSFGRAGNGSAVEQERRDVSTTTTTTRLWGLWVMDYAARAESGGRVRSDLIYSERSGGACGAATIERITAE